MAWSPVVQSDTYTLATVTGSWLHFFTLNPYQGTVEVHAVNMGSVAKPFTCLLFSPDGAWLHGGSTSGEVVTSNVLRGTVQLVHPVGSGGVCALLQHGPKVCCRLGTGRPPLIEG